MKNPHSLAIAAFLAITPAALTHAGDFASYQAADVVIGKTNFTTNTPTTASATNTNVTSDVSVDPATGELFVCDEANNRVLRFSSAAAAASGAPAEVVFGQPDFVTATINTGGLSATSLDDPAGIHVDSSGALWVADAGNHRVLRFDDATGAATASTVTADQVIGQADFTTATSGTSLSTLDNPRDVWVDASGNLWVADASNNRVLRFDAVAGLGNGPNASRVFGQPSGISNAVATTPVGMDSPVSVCVDGGGALWVADEGNNRVLRFNAAAAVAVDGPAASGVLGQADFISANATVTRSGLSSPSGVNVNASGRLWVSDFNNNRVLWFNNAASKSNGGLADGVLGRPNFISPAAGLSERRFDGPLGLFQDAAGHLWVADSSNHRALRFTAPVPPSPQPPVITLTGKFRHVFPAASQHIKGRSHDSDGVVVAVMGSVNGRPFTLAKGTTTWRYHAKKLRKGRNHIRIFAIDDDGLESNFLHVRIIRKTPHS
jgi:sugar lactone lactonase YvrE